MRPLPIFHGMPPTSGSKTTKQGKGRKERREFWIEETSKECDKESNKENQELEGLGGKVRNQTKDQRG